MDDKEKLAAQLQDEEKKKRADKLTFFRLRDVSIVAGLLLLALALWLVFRPGAPSTVAVATIGLGSQQSTQIIPLNKNGTLHIDAVLPVTLEVKDGAIRFINSVCPDHLCEQYGWLRSDGDWAACLPAEVVLRVLAEPTSAALAPSFPQT